MRINPGFPLILLQASLLCACSGTTNGSSPETGTPSATAAVAQVEDATAVASDAQTKNDASGTFELAGTTYPFHVTGCDLSGTAADGILLRGNGSAADGRRITVEVERLVRSSGSISESAVVYFGSIMEGDHWKASRLGKDGLWYSGEASQSMDGPLIRISGTKLVVTDTYRHETSHDQEAGTLSATCAGAN